MDLLPVVRTSAEAHLYIELHPCRCGETAFSPNNSVIEVDGVLASRYAGPCPNCGIEREFVFTLPEQIVMPLPATVSYGGPTPSALIDPGEWLSVADSFAGAAPDRSATGAAAARTLVDTAAAAVAEVIKFVPAGADSVPPEAFRSELGQRVYGAEPGRFYLDRLVVLQQTYREISAEYQALGD